MRVFRSTRKRARFFIKFGFLCSLSMNLLLMIFLFKEGYIKLLERVHVAEEQTGIIWNEKCHKCFKHKFKYVIQNENICDFTTSNSSVDIVFLIFSSISNTEKRSLIRKTWMTVAQENRANIRYAFFFGLSEIKSDNAYLKKESNMYKDIIQENFIDSYQNLTFKTVMAFKWATSKCSSAKFVFKADDDIFVNVQAILHGVLAENSEKLQAAIGGLCWHNEKPHRNKTSKYYVSNITYPYDVYPPFCSGTGYITSMKVVKQVYRVSESVAFFPLEDVYIGLCLKKLGYKTRKIIGFYNVHVIISPCFVGMQNLLTSHENTPQEIEAAWDTKCTGNNYLKNYTDNVKILSNVGMPFNAKMGSHHFLFGFH